MASSKTYSFLVFIAISFLIGAPAFYVSTLQPPVGVQVLLFLAGSYGTAFAAWVTLRIFRLFDESRSWVNRLRRWHSNLAVYLISIGLPTAIWLVTASINSFQGTTRNYAWLSLAAFPLVFVTNYGEEIGWRGFALPRLMNSFQPTTASIILGVIWGIFHIPLYWQRPLFALLFLALTPALSILLTWVFIKSNGSVLLTTLFHATYNTWVQVFLTANGEQIMAISVGVAWVFVLLLLVRYGFGLSHSPASLSEG